MSWEEDRRKAAQAIQFILGNSEPGFEEKLKESGIDPTKVGEQLNSIDPDTDPEASSS